jgi:hypothetical protein
MRDHVRETEMMFFFENFLPLANTLREKGERLKANGSDLEAKVFDTLYLQVWSLNIAGSALFSIVLNHV